MWLAGLTWQGVPGVRTASGVTVTSPPFRRMKSKCFLRFLKGTDSGRRTCCCEAQSEEVEELAAIMRAEAACSSSL